MPTAVFDAIDTDFNFVIEENVYTVDIGEAQDAVARAYYKGAQKKESHGLDVWDTIINELQDWVNQRTQKVLSRTQIFLFIQGVNVAWLEFKKKSNATLKSQITSDSMSPTSPTPGSKQSDPTSHDLPPTENFEPVANETG